MKKLLLASSALVLSAGVAAAEVRVGGDGRMGIIKGFGTDDLAFTSRIRISFAASGETDGGLTFGGSIRADNSGGGNNGDTDDAEDTFGDVGRQTAGSVFISGAFGRLTMGDVSGAAEAAVGDVAGVGLTGLGDLNEATYLSNGGAGVRPTMRYDYTTGALGFHLSADNPIASEAYSVAVTYNGGAFKGGLGYEVNDDIDADHIIAGVEATFGGATVKAIYGTADIGGASGDQYGVSLAYAFDAITATVFYYDDEELGGAEAYGIGAAYSLGGGATLRGGYVQDETNDDDAFDFGIALTF